MDINGKSIINVIETRNFHVNIFQLSKTNFSAGIRRKFSDRLVSAERRSTPYKYRLLE